jgi:type 2 lantibiotic biosynthesis protein LanM
MVSSQSSDSLSIQTATQNASWYQALTLAERLAVLHTDATRIPIEANGNLDLAQRRLQKWKAQSPFERIPFFADRLALDGITEEELCTLLGMPIETLRAYVSQEPLWLRTLTQAFASFDSTERFEMLMAQQSQKPAEFLQPITPLLKQGIERLRSGIKALVDLHTDLPFAQESIAPLLFSHILTSSLTAMLKTFTLELNIARLQGRLQGETPEARFHSFIQLLCQPGEILTLLELYPVLARLLVTIIDQGVAFGLELLGHLCADWQEIRTHLMQGKNPGKLVEVQIGAGDAHRQGRSVAILTFQSGLKLIYKPKSLAIDTHFQALLAWLNTFVKDLPFRAVQVLDRGTYGWSEYVQATGCTEEGEITRFYERLGGYLALMYALGGVDLHFENLLACGEHPMFVDLETLFQPAFPPQSNGEETATPEAFAFLHASVLRLGLLPQQIWMTENGDGIDVSGLGGKGGQITPLPVPMLDGIGTDQMHMVRRHGIIQDRQNQPKLNNIAIDIMDYLNHVIRGFTRIYRLLIVQREALLTQILPLFAHDEIRIVLRPTNIYARLLQESLHPTLLHNALDRDRLLDRLWIQVPRKPFLSRIIRAEIDDLRENNIPFFTTSVTSCSLTTSRGMDIANFFDESGFVVAERRIRQFNEQDLSRQIWVIQASFATKVLGHGSATWKPSHLLPPQNKASQERLLQAARAAGDRLCETAIIGKNEISWLDFRLLQERSWSVTVTGFDLYSGVAGICLFLAYLGIATQEIKYTTLARQIVDAIHVYKDTSHANTLSSGAFYGWGGLIYLYTHLAVLWQDASLLIEAEKLAERLMPTIAQDQQFDLTGGVAGGICALLMLYRISPSPSILDIARQCGDYLLARATTTSAGMHWRSVIVQEQPFAGYADGAAGIALSLFDLAALSGEERFRQAALAAITYERSQFSQEAQNGSNLCTSEQMEGSLEKSYAVTWCRGAPGIGLARLKSLRYLDDDTAREEIALALQTTLTHGFHLNHSLCHGDLGNLDVLFTAGQLLDDEHYRTEAARLTAMVLDSIERQGWCTGVPLGVEVPGLMMGIAGIGYQLLRLARPDLVPSVLALEPPYRLHQEEMRG